MTVAQSKDFVKQRHPKACWGLLVNNDTGQRWYYIWDGVGSGDPVWGKGDTIGRAWKKAATRIELDEQPSQIGETMWAITERLATMTPAEFRESLVRTGVVDHDGKLTEQYRQ